MDYDFFELDSIPNQNKDQKIEELEKEIGILYQALKYCVERIDDLSDQKDWQLELIKKAIVVAEKKVND